MEMKSELSGGLRGRGFKIKVAQKFLNSFM